MAAGAIAGIVGTLGTAVAGIFTKKEEAKIAKTQLEAKKVDGQNQLAVLREQQKLQQLSNDNEQLKSILQLRVSENQLKQSQNQYIIYGVLGLVALLVLTRKS